MTRPPLIIKSKLYANSVCAFRSRGPSVAALKKDLRLIFSPQDLLGLFDCERNQKLLSKKSPNVSNIKALSTNKRPLLWLSENQKEAVSHVWNLTYFLRKVVAPLSKHI